MVRAWIWIGRCPCYQGWPHYGAEGQLQTLKVWLQPTGKEHVSRSICLGTVLSWSTRGTLWIHPIFLSSWHSTKLKPDWHMH
jgi:hypothetical protein